MWLHDGCSLPLSGYAACESFPSVARGSITQPQGCACLSFGSRVNDYVRQQKARLPELTVLVEETAPLRISAADIWGYTQRVAYERYIRFKYLCSYAATNARPFSSEVIVMLLAHSLHSQKYSPLRISLPRNSVS